MKETTLAKILAVACGLAAVTALAQTSTTVTTTKDAAAGTEVTETTTTSSRQERSRLTRRAAITSHFASRAQPARRCKYYYTKNTTVLDPEGRTVTWSAVRPDLPATVYYVREGDRMIVRKVVLSKPRCRKRNHDHDDND